uniref:Uncharacterized protein n=1 Tax=Glossina austeni TaxID=7395 RepID=A0A1A9UZR4_GLOAU
MKSLPSNTMDCCLLGASFRIEQLLLIPLATGTATVGEIVVGDSHSYKKSEREELGKACPLLVNVREYDGRMLYRYCAIFELLGAFMIDCHISCITLGVVTALGPAARNS